MENNFLNPNFTLVAKNMEFFHKVAKKFMTGYYADFAEDAAQSSILKALKKIDSFSPSQSKFTTWAYELVKNTCFDILKEKCNFLTKNGSLDERAGGLCFLGDDLNDKMKFKLFRNAIFKLKKRDQQLVLLKIRFKCSAREMSQITGIPEKSINMFMLRAKCNLHENLLATGFDYY